MELIPVKGEEEEQFHLTVFSQIPIVSKTALPAVCTALSKTNHELIRQKALNLLLSEPTQPNWYDGIELLASSFRDGDQEIIEQVLYSKDFPFDDSYKLHSAGMKVRKLIDNYPDESFEKLCSWFYDRTPCSLCRRQFVEHLIARQSASPGLLEECLNDSDEDTRKLAQTALDDKAMR